MERQFYSPFGYGGYFNPNYLHNVYGAYNQYPYPYPYPYQLHQYIPYGQQYVPFYGAGIGGFSGGVSAGGFHGGVGVGGFHGGVSAGGFHGSAGVGAGGFGGGH